MGNDRALRSDHPERRRLPVDLLGVVFLAVVANLAMATPGISDSPLRAIVGLPYVLLLPGYALIAALFPEAGHPPGDTRKPGEALTAGRSTTVEPSAVSDSRPASRGIDGVERVALSFALSIAIVPLLAIGLTLSPLGFAVPTLVTALNAFILGNLVIATLRRWRRPMESRFYVPYRQWWATGSAHITGRASGTNAVLNVGLAIAIVFAVGTLSAAMVMPPDGEEYTEFYVLGEEAGGDLVAAGYPESLVVGEPAPVHLGIENYEREDVKYDVVIQLQRVEQSEDQTVVSHRTEVDRFSVVVGHNETWSGQQDVIAGDDLTGSDLQLVFLLYHDDVPDTPTRDNAYRDLFLWVDVGDPAE